MKKILGALVFVFLCAAVDAQEETITGYYQGKNPVVVNPFASTGVGFCIYEVSVNGQTATDEINSSSFELDLSHYGLKPGDRITIHLKHKSNCSPKILNPEVLKPKSTFKVLDIAVDRKTETLSWTTVEENGRLAFSVQQFKWNKWVNVAEVEGNGTPSKNSYSIRVHPTTGDSKFRLRQIDFTKQPRFSQEVVFRSLKAAVTMKVAHREIEFSADTEYEIFDQFGKKVLSGFSSKVDLAKLPKGHYYINYDNKNDEFKL